MEDRNWQVDIFQRINWRKYNFLGCMERYFSLIYLKYPAMIYTFHPPPGNSHHILLLEFTSSFSNIFLFIHLLYFKSLTTTYAHEHGTSIVLCTDWQCGILKPKCISSFPLPSTSQTVVGPQETFCSPCFIFVWSGLMIFRSYTCISIVCSLVQQPYHVTRRAFFNTPTPPPKLRLF